MRRRIRVGGWTAGALALVLTITACGGQTAGGGGTPGGAVTAPATSARFDERAREVAKAWRSDGRIDSWTSGFVPFEALVASRDWPDDDSKAAFGAGWIRASQTLPTGKAQGRITFPDGSTLSVRLTSADETLSTQAPPRLDPCPAVGADGACTWLTVVSAKATTTTLDTSRGAAKVPAWAYTIKGVDEPLLIVAVDPRDMNPTDNTTEPVPGSIDFAGAQDLTFAAGRKIDYRIGIGACDTEPRPLIKEFDDIIVLGGQITPPPEGTACTAQLLMQPLSVELDAAIGDRPIVDGASGLALRLAGLY